MTPTAPARLDHLVIVANNLDQGTAWCEATLGVTPATGGVHPLMGTHNRLLRIDTPAFPLAYLEIIAIDPMAARPASRTHRWFDMDDATLQAGVAKHGPQLAHWVAAVPDVRRAVDALAGHGIDRGEVIEASRMTAAGCLRWQITVRADGQRLFGGALPTLIEWGDTHPTPALPDAGIRLVSWSLAHPQAAELAPALEAVGLGAIPVAAQALALTAVLETPRGRVQLGTPPA